MRYTLSRLFIYPVKALGGIEVQEATITNTGFSYDRFWMLIDSEARFITQRDLPELAKMSVAFVTDGIQVNYKQTSIHIPFKMENPTEELETEVWGKKMVARKEIESINDWFSQQLNKEVFLVRQGSSKRRKVRTCPTAEIHFPDSSQYLLIGQAAVDNLNQKLDQAIRANRFRANLIFEGGAPHDEDNWKEITIGNVNLEVTKSCARCKVITINQETLERGKEPLRTLAKYRFSDNKVWFGRYLNLKSGLGGTIKVGDQILVG